MSLLTPGRRASLAYQARVLRVTARIEFKLKYEGSALGYVWSVIKPLALFFVLWVVFGRIFRVGAVFPDYPLYLLIGIWLWTLFVDATMLGMHSLVSRGSLLRKMSFPRAVIPVSATLVAATTFAINACVIAVFVAARGIVPRLDWLLILPLLLELYLFTVAVASILATTFVRFRDTSQVWELLSQLLFYASPVIYPLGLLPSWARSLSMLNPFSQVAEDVREIVLYKAPPGAVLTANDVLGGVTGRIWPVLIAVGTFVVAVKWFRHEEPWFAERA